MLQGCSCLSGVKTYLPALCCRSAAGKAVSKPICRALCSRAQGCVSGVPTYLLDTVLQGCSCLRSVATYLPALCCSCLSGVATYLPGTVLQGCSCFSIVRTYLLGTVLQGSSCLIGVATYLPALRCRGAAV